MERSGRLTALFAIVMLPWFEPSPCRAQSSAPLESTLPQTGGKRGRRRRVPPAAGLAGNESDGKVDDAHPSATPIWTGGNRAIAVNAGG